MMRPLTDRELLAYAAHALDPGETRAVEEALAADPDTRRRLAALTLEMDRHRGVDRWHHPLVPLPDPERRLAVVLERERALGRPADARLVPGDHVGLRLAYPGEARAWRPVVVREVQGRAEVIYPTTADEWVTLDHWPDARGARVLDIVIDAPGDLRYTVILADAPAEVDWSAEGDGRWAAVRAEVEEGRLPASSLRVQVDPGG